jgi:hypothetical protein
MPATERLYGLNAQDSAALIADAHMLYTPERIDTFQESAALNKLWALSSADDRRLWWSLVVNHPQRWARHRLRVFRWLTWPPDVDRCLPYVVGVDGQAVTLKALGMIPHLRPQDPDLLRYAQMFQITPVYYNGFWLLVAVGLVAFLLLRQRREPGTIAIVGLLLTALVFAGSFLLIGIACDVRYMYLVPVSVTFAWLYIATPLQGHSCAGKHPVAEPGSIGSLQSIPLDTPACFLEPEKG